MMSFKFQGHALMGLVSAALVFAPFQVSPALAQSDCTCVLPASAGPVGAISNASPDVFITGATAQQPATAGAPIGPSSVVTTGPGASATIDMGAGCTFAMAGSMRMQIVPQQGGLCVQVIDESVGTPGAGDQTAVIAALAAGGGVVVSLGLLNSVSK